MVKSFIQLFNELPSFRYPLSGVRFFSVHVLEGLEFGGDVLFVPVD